MILRLLYVDEAIWGCAKILCSRVELEVTTDEGVFSMFLFVCLFGQGNIRILRCYYIHLLVLIMG